MPATLDGLVRHLRHSAVLKSPQIIEAFLKIDRKDFVPGKWQSEAYEDYPLPTLLGQTISQPWTVAFMLELLQPQAGQKILDIGFGSGWTTALLAYIVSSPTQQSTQEQELANPNEAWSSGSRLSSPAAGERSANSGSDQKCLTGEIYAVEILPEVFEFGKSNIEKYNFINKGVVKIYCQDGSGGLPAAAPFDRILVSAAAPIVPEPLRQQLKTGGILVIPDPEGIYQIIKTATGFDNNYFKGFAFVPLHIGK